MERSTTPLLSEPLVQVTVALRVLDCPITSEAGCAANEEANIGSPGGGGGGGVPPFGSTNSVTLCAGSVVDSVPFSTARSARRRIWFADVSCHGSARTASGKFATFKKIGWL